MVKKTTVILIGMMIVDSYQRLKDPYMQLMLPQSLENKPQMIFMLIFSGTEHKYIIQVNKNKVINVFPHKTVYQPLEG